MPSMPHYEGASNAVLSPGVLFSWEVDSTRTKGGRGEMLRVMTGRFYGET